MAERTEAGWHGFWCREGVGVRVLSPLGWLWAKVAHRRHDCHLRGYTGAFRAPLPVIVVGNLSVGGNGKTPFVAALVDWLRGQGWKPGIVSRGYVRGRLRSRNPRVVDAHAHAAEVGDEAVLLVRRTGAPLVVGANRPEAVRCLLEQDVDIVVSDDGLQRYDLARDLEIVMVDGLRGLGNGRCLPAGPLREPPERLASVDLIVATAPLTSAVAALTPWAMRLVPIGLLPGSVCELASEMDADGLLPLTRLPAGPVHAVAGIGHPERFFRTLEELGLEVVPHPFPDHHVFTRAELDLPGTAPILMTEKDLLRCRAVWADWPHALRRRCMALCVKADVDNRVFATIGDRLPWCRPAGRSEASS